MWVKALRILLHGIIWLLVYLLPYLVAYGETSAATLYKNLVMLFMRSLPAFRLPTPM